MEKKVVEKILKIILIVIIILIILTTISIISMRYLLTANPVRALIGYVGVKVFDKECVEVGNIPWKVFYAKDGNAFDRYMESKGFTEIKEEQMGHGLVYTNGVTKENVTFWLEQIDGYPCNIYVWHY